MLRTHRRVWVWVLGGAFAILLLGTALGPRLSAFNFRVIAPGMAYRSNRLSSAAFERLAKEYGIRTVVSLDGEHMSGPLQSIATRKGIRFISLPLRSGKLPRRSQLLELLDVLEGAESPVLLMEGFGIYKVGLASAFLGIIRLGQDIPAARRALSLRYGFVPYGPFTEVIRAFSLYEAWLARHRLRATKETLGRWAREGYLPYGYGTHIRPVRIPTEARPGEPVHLTIEVENISDRTWPRRTDPNTAIKLGLRLAPHGGPPFQEFRGDFIPHELPPGGRVRLSLEFRAPGSTGPYQLRVDLVEERRAWFGDWGSPPATFPLRVR